MEEWRHERFARGFEIYIKEGKAPTGRLAAIFEKGKKFLRAVYHGFTDSGGRASAEVEAVMAKLITIAEQRSLKYTEALPPRRAQFSCGKGGTSGAAQKVESGVYRAHGEKAGGAGIR